MLRGVDVHQAEIDHADDLLPVGVVEHVGGDAPGRGEAVAHLRHQPVEEDGEVPPVELRLGGDLLNVAGELREAPAELGGFELPGHGRILWVAGGEVLDDLQPGARVPHLQLELGAALEQRPVPGAAGGDLLDRGQLGGAVAARQGHLAGRLQGDGLRRPPALEQRELLLGLVDLLGAQGLVQPVGDDLHGAGVELAGPLQGERAARGHGAVGRIGEGHVAQALGGAADQHLARRVGGQRVVHRQQARDHVRILAGREVDLGRQNLGGQEARARVEHFCRSPDSLSGIAGIDEVVPDPLQPVAELGVGLPRVPLHGVEHVGPVCRVQGKGLRSLWDRLADGRWRRGRSTGEGRRQQDAEDRGRGDPAPWAAPDLRVREAPRKWWRWHACR